MATRTQQSTTRPAPLALTEGATTPNPGTVNALAWSITVSGWMRWTGTKWTVTTDSYATRTKYGVD